ncbi:MAG: hypothetical protein ACI9NY_001110, partial [Kiritimatiellia bacterium]
TYPLASVRKIKKCLNSCQAFYPVFSKLAE